MNVSAPGLRGARLCDAGSSAISSRVLGERKYLESGTVERHSNFAGWKRHTDFQQEASLD